MDHLSLDNKVILVTGAAGFIGANLVKRLMRDLTGATIVGIDNMNDYYDPSLKASRLHELEELSTIHYSLFTFHFIKGDIADRSLVDKVFADYHPQIVVNLAAQAGVRYSITNPDAYIQSNLIGFYNILEACRSTMGTDPDAAISDGTAGSVPSVLPTHSSKIGANL